MNPPQSIYLGYVIRARYATGSKQEHDAVMLEAQGGPYRLRRIDGPSFADDVLDALVGHSIECEAVRHADTLIVHSYRIID